MDVHFIDRPCSKKAKRLLENPAPGSVYLMENLKFYPAEMGRDAEPRKFGSTRKPDDSSLTGVSEISKDEVPESSGSVHVIRFVSFFYNCKVMLKCLKCVRDF